MLKSIAIIAVVGGSALMCSVSAARSQGVANAYNAGTYTRPTISPYLNLGVTPSGLSNYQMLVKPMLDEQDALSVQSANMAQLQQKLRQGVQATDPNAKDPYSRTKTVRFMNYSHFYGR
jgi:hypothetical protein